MAEIRLESNKGYADNCVYVFDNSKNILGEGGMGVVYLGKRIDPNGMESQVAIKELKNNDKDIVERARREASIQLNNDNLVRMYGLIETESDDALRTKKHYVISEYLDGVTLDLVLEGKLENRNGEIAPYIQEFHDEYNSDRNKSATHIIKCVLSGIMALHDAGYIHRDIKLTNIMVTADGKVKLIDFGIAKKLDDLNKQEPKLTTPGQFVGTAEYAAPEQIFSDSKNQGFYTDVYSIGVLYYELVVGHLPFEGNAWEVTQCHLNKKLPLKDIKSWQIREIIGKATQKKQVDRYASAALFRAAIDNIVYPEPKRANYKLVAVAVAVVLVAIVFVVAKGFGGANAEEETAEVVQPVDTFQLYLNQLNYADDDSIQEGFKGMMTLAEQGNVDAMYEIAVTFSAKAKEDDSSTATRKLGLKLKLDYESTKQNQKAVEWLEKTIAASPANYKALYRLAPYYFYGKGGLDASTEKCLKLLEKAHSLAVEAGDADYIERTDRLLNNLK